jgi:uncharacterized protein YegP (UPF0339 family)
MKRLPRVEAYQDIGGLWRWRLKAGNGQVINGPQQGFTRKADALKNYRTVKAAMAVAELVE